VFLDDPPSSEGAAAAYDSDRESDGYVGNVTRLWCWRPDILFAFTDLRAQLGSKCSLTPREQAVIVTATAAAMGDSYCALAWGSRLAHLAGDETAAGVIAGEQPAELSEREAALAEWCHAVVADPTATTGDQVDALRSAGLDDREIFEATLLLGLRLAFSTVNDALGALPDRQLADEAPAPVRDAVSFGRPASETPSIA
jgi:uncharacterized peroxidase-related enzyme